MHLRLEMQVCVSSHLFVLSQLTLYALFISHKHLLQLGVKVLHRIVFQLLLMVDFLHKVTRVLHLRLVSQLHVGVIELIKLS